MYGVRPQLRRKPNGIYEQISNGTKDSGLNDDSDVLDEIGVFDTDEVTETGLQSSSMDHEDDSIMAHDDPGTPSTPSNRQPGLARQLVLRVPEDFEKRGSPVFEEPKHDTIRYSVPNVTPPSRKAQALPTP